MLIFNIGSRKQKLWTFVETSNCEHCQNCVQHVVVCEWKRLSLYFIIPVMSYNERWYVECPICSHRRAISRQNAKSTSATLSQTFEMVA